MLLEVKELTIEFHDHIIPETVVENLSFSMKEGEILGIVGESGSGKSMTALAIAGLLRRKDMQKTGQILFDGTDLLSCPRAKLRSYQGREISMIFQEPMTSLNPVMKVGKQVEESMRVHERISKEEMKRRALLAMEEAELDFPEEVYNRYPHELSGGMRQRVMIAAALTQQPKLLIADEPTTALDVTIQAQIIQLLKRMNTDKKMAIIFISHDLSLVRQLSNRVIVMRKGKMVESGDTESLFLHPKEAYTRQLLDAIPKVDI